MHAVCCSASLSAGATAAADPRCSTAAGLGNRRADLSRPADPVQGALARDVHAPSGRQAWEVSGHCRTQSCTCRTCSPYRIVRLVTSQFQKIAYVMVQRLLAYATESDDVAVFAPGLGCGFSDGVVRETAFFLI